MFTSKYQVQMQKGWIWGRREKFQKKNRKMEVEYLWKAIFRPVEEDKDLLQDEEEAEETQSLRNREHYLQGFAKWLVLFFFQPCLSGSNPDIQMSRELYFLLQSWGQASKTKTSSPCCAYNSTLSLKRFCGRQESSGKIYIYYWNKGNDSDWLA